MGKIAELQASIPGERVNGLPYQNNNDKITTAGTEEQETSYSASQRDPIDDISCLAGSLNIGEDGQPHYFGPLSNCHLLRGPLYLVSTESIECCRKRGLDMLTRLGKPVDIPQDLQDHLLELYWTWENSWLYLIHKDTFLQDYHGGKTGKYCTTLLLLAISALAARYSRLEEIRSDPTDPQTAGDVYAEQARVLLMHEQEVATVTTVQAACLLSLWSMANNKETQGWLHIGE